jgi:hypothetical protein
LTLHIPTWRFWPQRYEILENLYLVGSGGSWHSLLNHVTSNPSPCISDPHLTAPAASFLLPPRAETSWQLVLHQNGEGSPTKTVNYSSLMIGQLVQLTRLTTFLIFLADISVVLRGMTGLCRLTCEGHVGSWNPGPRAMTRQLAVVVPIVEDRPLANGFLAGPFCLRHILETHNIYIYIQYVDIEYVIIYIYVGVYYIKGKYWTFWRCCLAPGRANLDACTTPSQQSSTPSLSPQSPGKGTGWDWRSHARNNAVDFTDETWTSTLW